MARQIYIVDAMQVVTSSSHPEGLFSHMTNYPATFDSRAYPATDNNPNGDAEKAYRMAEADYLSRIAAILSADNPSRAMAVVTFSRADGVQIAKRKIGDMPDMTPVPEPELELNEEQGE